SQAPPGKRVASWAAVCPGNKQSGGKRLSGKTRRGKTWLKAVLCEVAWANARSQTSYVGAQFRRLTRRRGVYKALIAVAHSLLVIIYHVLKTKRPYHDSLSARSIGGIVDLFVRWPQQREDLTMEGLQTEHHIQGGVGSMADMEQIDALEALEPIFRTALC